MEVKFKKNVLDKTKGTYFPLNEKVFLSETRFKKLKENVAKVGNEEDYFEIVQTKKTIKKAKTVEA